MQIRRLVPADWAWVVNELRELPKQSAKFAHVPDDVEHVYGYMITMPIKGVVCPDTRSFLLFAVSCPWYMDILQAHEMILWVPQEFRGGRSAFALIKEFTKYADDLAALEIHAGHSLDITDKEVTFRLYEKCGFKRDGIGVVYKLER